MTERARPDPHWDVRPLVKIEAEIGYTCPDERCGEHGKFVTPVTRDGSTEGRAIRDRDRCPTCLTTVVGHVA
jgi:hypothetical protein